jgi:hypothetical protein
MISNTARTPWPSPSCSNRRRIRGFLLIPAVDAGSTTVCTTLQQLPAGQPQAVKIVVQNNRRMRALSATAFYSRAALQSDETARVKRGVARRTRPFETKVFSRDRDSRREFATRVQHWSWCRCADGPSQRSQPCRAGGRRACTCYPAPPTGNVGRARRRRQELVQGEQLCREKHEVVRVDTLVGYC